MTSVNILIERLQDSGTGVETVAIADDILLITIIVGLLTAIGGDCLENSRIISFNDDGRTYYSYDWWWIRLGGGLVALAAFVTLCLFF